MKDLDRYPASAGRRHVAERAALDDVAVHDQGAAYDWQRGALECAEEARRWALSAQLDSDADSRAWKIHRASVYGHQAKLYRESVRRYAECAW